MLLEYEDKLFLPPPPVVGDPFVLAGRGNLPREDSLPSTSG